MSLFFPPKINKRFERKKKSENFFFYREKIVSKESDFFLIEKRD